MEKVKRLKNQIKTMIVEILNEQKINENSGLSKRNTDSENDRVIQNLFFKYERDPNVWPKGYPVTSYGWPDDLRLFFPKGFPSLERSLKRIGGGEITKKDDDFFMYKEMLKNNSFFLIVFGRENRDSQRRGFRYELTVYRNNPTNDYTFSHRVVKHPVIISYFEDYNTFHLNEKAVSKVCAHVKKYVVENFE